MAGLAGTARAVVAVWATDDELAGAEAVVIGKTTPESITQNSDGTTVEVTLSDVLRGNFKKGETVRVRLQCEIVRGIRPGTPGLAADTPCRRPQQAVLRTSRP